MTEPGLLAQLEAFFDAVPRGRASAEEYGGLVLFVPDGQGTGFYGRPRPDGPPATAADIAELRERQRELGLPEALEWVHDLNPTLIGLAQESGLGVLRAPLMVLDPTALPAPPDNRPDPDTPDAQPEPTVRLILPGTHTFAEDLAAVDAVAAVGFAAPGTGGGDAGSADRDAANVPFSGERLRAEAARLEAGLSARAVAETADLGIAACGRYQRAGDVVEIIAVATLPAARGRGLASAVTMTLAHHALADGARVVFLSAAADAVARIYAKLGFRRIGTACIAEPPQRVPDDLDHSL